VYFLWNITIFTGQYFRSQALGTASRARLRALGSRLLCTLRCGLWSGSEAGQGRLRADGSSHTSDLLRWKPSDFLPPLPGAPPAFFGDVAISCFK
jgi:hypothetical protein